MFIQLTWIPRLQIGHSSTHNDYIVVHFHRQMFNIYFIKCLFLKTTNLLTLCLFYFPKKFKAKDYSSLHLTPVFVMKSSENTDWVPKCVCKRACRSLNIVWVYITKWWTPWGRKESRFPYERVKGESHERVSKIFTTNPHIVLYTIVNG